MAQKKKSSSGKKKTGNNIKTAKAAAKAVGKMKPWQIALVLILAVALIAVCGFVYFKYFYQEPVPAEGVLKVHMIDVGQGDCLLIQFPDGRHMMIDAGGNETASGINPEKKIIDYVNKHVPKGEENTPVIDYLMLTHSDQDHCDFIDEVIENFEVRNIFLPKLDAVSDGKSAVSDPPAGSVGTIVYARAVNAAQNETYTENGVTKSAAVNYNVGIFDMDFGQTAYSMKNYCMTEEYYKTVKSGSAKALNSVSPISVLEYAGRKIVFSGDATGESHDNFLENLPKLQKFDSDVYKVAHHGSSTNKSNPQEFLEKIDAEYALISAGTKKNHGLPDDTLMERLRAYRDLVPDGDHDGFIEILITAVVGDIVVSVNEDGTLNVDKEKTADGKSTVSIVRFEMYCLAKRY